ncbi:hypothetical protein D3C78_1341680 [compost metagenome]
MLTAGPDVFRTAEDCHERRFLVLVDVLHPVEIPSLVALHNGFNCRFRRPVGPANRNAAVMALANGELHVWEGPAQLGAHVGRCQLPAVNVIALGQVRQLRRRLQALHLDGKGCRRVLLRQSVGGNLAFRILQQLGDFLGAGLIAVNGPLDSADDGLGDLVRDRTVLKHHVKLGVAAAHADTVRHRLHILRHLDAMNRKDHALAAVG